MSMSASRPFLEQIVKRFTGLGRDRRAALGLPVAFLVLDPHATEQRGELLSPLAVPGLLELAPTGGGKKALLHAKLALLAFGRSRVGPPSTLRLVVSTANWTDRSARHQLELAWHVDVSCGSRGALAAADPVDRADVAAAGGFARRVLEGYDAPSTNRDGLAFAQRLHDLLNRCEDVAPSRGVRPRFIHSLDGPLLGALESAVCGKRGLNFLACGSGSFESAPKSGRKDLEPKVLKVLSGLVPDDATKIVTTEPSAAGALAGWAHRAGEDGWSVREPSDPIRRREPRALHAKFVFVGHASRRQVLRGTLYLGSGNLTFRGFRWGVPQHGNIECGVILAFPGACMFDEALESLYVSRKEVSPEDLAEDSAHEDEPDVKAEPLIEVPPLRGVRLLEDEVGAYLELHWRPEVNTGERFRVLIDDRTEDIEPSVERVRLADGVSPGVIRIERGKGVEPWTIAVETHSLRVAASPEAPESFDEAMAKLLDFPAAADDAAEDQEDENEDGAEERDPDAAPPPATTVRALRDDLAKYPLQKAMEFLDGLGAHQARVPPYLLDDWVQHLEVMLDSQFRPPELGAWRAVGVPFRRALLAAGFRPAALNEAQLRRYRSIVDRFVRAVEGR
ncbi:hypothetical protein ACOQFB_05335 [Anaeromyxobacter sp. Red801]|uniref:hypothetical protein n=1 Tax=Anaeromyxobacter sp. Red801 TaxID=3411632 RepID=UPI003BA1B79B